MDNSIKDAVERLSEISDRAERDIVKVLQPILDRVCDEANMKPVLHISLIDASSKTQERAIPKVRLSFDLDESMYRAKHGLR